MVCSYASTDGFMSWILNNWVERRAAKERNLGNQAELWNKVQASLAEACDSLKKYYSHVACIRQTNQNGKILLTITRSPLHLNHAERLSSAVVQIEFDDTKHQILVIVDHKKSRSFLIEADSDHTFITFHQRELLLDEFSQLALEEAFFTTSQAKRCDRTLRLVK
jgi:hypothetical protein